MTETEFAALAKLISLRHGKAREAARLVLVDGCTNTTAAAQTGLTRQGVSNALQRARTGLELARQAVGQGVRTLT